MISTQKDSNGLVIAYMESRVVGQSGFDKLSGEYLYIADLWIHKDYKNDWSIFRGLINTVLFKCISVNQIYFNRQKYGGRMSKNYSREKIMQLASRISSEVYI